MNIGDVAVLPGVDTVTILRLDDINAASQDDDRSNALVAQISEQLNQTLAQDLYGIFADEVVSRAGPQIDQRALQAVHVNFP
jgi:peptidyl-prolyl cis-trans isomerase D